MPVTMMMTCGAVECPERRCCAPQGVTVSRRTLQRAVQPYRQALKAEANTTALQFDSRIFRPPPT